MSGLFARNFERDFEEAVLPSDGAPPNEMISLDEAELLAERSRNEGFERGKLEGATAALTKERLSREARCEAALLALTEQFSEFANHNNRIRTEIELEFSELILGVGERILPDIFETHIADLLVARIHSAIHGVVGTGKIKIRVPPELTDTVVPRLGSLADSAAANNLPFEVCADSQIEDGTIQIDWHNGTLEYDPGIASLEVLETLKEAVVELRAQLESEE